MCSYHQPQQIINEKTIPSQGRVLKPKPFFGLFFMKRLFWRTNCMFLSMQRDHFTSILAKRKGKREKGILSLKTHCLEDKALSAQRIASRWISVNNCPIKLASTTIQKRNWACPTPLSQVIIETVDFLPESDRVIIE